MFGIRDCAQKQIQLEVQGKSWARVAKLADNVSSRNEIKSIHLFKSGYEIYFFAARNCVHTDQFLWNFLKPPGLLVCVPKDEDGGKHIVHQKNRLQAPTAEIENRKIVSNRSSNSPEYCYTCTEQLIPVRTLIFSLSHLQTVPHSSLSLPS